jgi:putative DNA methylase
MINKALIEIPPRFANMPPVNPRDREKFGGGEGWRGAHGLAADVRYYGEWMRTGHGSGWPVPETTVDGDRVDLGAHGQVPEPACGARCRWCASS